MRRQYRSGLQNLHDGRRLPRPTPLRPHPRRTKSVTDLPQALTFGPKLGHDGNRILLSPVLHQLPVPQLPAIGHLPCQDLCTLRSLQPPLPNLVLDRCPRGPRHFHDVGEICPLHRGFLEQKIFVVEFFFGWIYRRINELRPSSIWLVCRQVRGAIFRSRLVFDPLSNRV